MQSAKNIIITGRTIERETRLLYTFISYVICLILYYLVQTSVSQHFLREVDVLGQIKCSTREGEFYDVLMRVWPKTRCKFMFLHHSVRSSAVIVVLCSKEITLMFPLVMDALFWATNLFIHKEWFLLFMLGLVSMMWICINLADREKVCNHS